MIEAQMALVTGAIKGLGGEVARQLGRRGMRVCLGSRSAQRGQLAAMELLARGIVAAPLLVYVTDEMSVTEAARHLSTSHGRLDVLVANAGVLHRVAAIATDAAAMQATFDTNVFGTVLTIRAMLPLLQAAGHPRIVTFARASASLTLTSTPTTLYDKSDTSRAYASSKAAVTMLTLHFANAFRRSPAHAHIGINAATPGCVATDLNSFAGTRSVAQGAGIVIDLATLTDDGPSGGFFDKDGAVPW